MLYIFREFNILYQIRTDNVDAKDRSINHYTKRTSLLRFINRSLMTRQTSPFRRRTKVLTWARIYKRILKLYALLHSTPLIIYFFVCGGGVLVAARRCSVPPLFTCSPFRNRTPLSLVGVTKDSGSQGIKRKSIIKIKGGALVSRVFFLS